ncbi:MAG: hypothetical protein CMH25_02965 [Micavibrio sp.]|nr:hypothetical protein [Micavibrio sp.]|tara:strand:+ start:579694 stop:580782 length:1089 start_codon:yes stop_codon:yes gene_type:complete
MSKPEKITETFEKHGGFHSLEDPRVAKTRQANDDDNVVPLRQKYQIYDIPLEEHLERTGLDHLPQTQVIRDCLNHIKGDGLVEAYLRGSFSLGTADPLSDIDLFTVVEMDKVEDVHNRVLELLNEKYPVIATCADKVVADYGGIGFVFICEGPEGPFQLDVYMAMKGVAPRTHLFDCPRVFSGDPDYCWIEEKLRSDELPVRTERFMNKHMGHESKEDLMEFHLNDLLVISFMSEKHLSRDQYARGLMDNNYAIEVVTEMLMTSRGEATIHSSLYACDSVIKQVSEGDDPALASFATRLKELLPVSPSREKTAALLALGNDIYEHNMGQTPEHQTKMDRYFTAVESKYGNKDGNALGSDLKL